MVVALDESQHVLYELLVLGVVRDGEAEAFGSFDQPVHTDGQVLPRQVDVARVEEGQHPFGLKVAQVGVVGYLHLVYEVDHLLEEVQIGPSLARGLLHAAVEVDGQDALRTRGDPACTEGVAEAIVLDFVAQAAARGQRVGVVAHVGEEGVAGGVHFGRQVSVVAVDDVAVARQQGHRLDREGKYGFRALGVEPVHEAALQPVDALPVGPSAVGEDEVAEKALEVVAVVVGDVPEHGLIVAGARRLVDGVDNLFEAVGHDLVERAPA